MFLININTLIAQQKNKIKKYTHISIPKNKPSLSVSGFISETHRENPLCSPQLLPFSECRTEIKILGGQFYLGIEFGVSFSSLFFACCSISL